MTETRIRASSSLHSRDEDVVLLLLVEGYRKAQPAFGKLECPSRKPGPLASHSPPSISHSVQLSGGLVLSHTSYLSTRKCLKKTGPRMAACRRVTYVTLERCVAQLDPPSLLQADSYRITTVVACLSIVYMV
jgi:hypothetical protein